jgi:Family of unknown function (DUF6350)
MSLIDRVRNLTAPASAKASAKPSIALSGGPLRLRSAAAGCSAALVSMLIVALPALLVWVASPESTGEWSRAMSFGSCIWLLANGAQLSSGPATISLTPWLLSAIPLVVATIAARRILMQLDDGQPRRFKAWGSLRRDVADAALAFIASYATVGLVVALATGGDPLHTSALESVLDTALVGAVSVLIALSREFRGQISSVAPDLVVTLKARVSIHLRRAVRPGLWGVLAIFGAGLVLAVVTVGMHLGRIGRLYDALGADPVGTTMLTLGQLMVLPNVAIWAASWMAGPGFGFGDGSTITWSQSNPGLLPLIPGLGAVPDPGPLPAGLWLSALVPVGAGALVGWRSLRALARLSSWQVKAKGATAACLVAALCLTLAGVLAGGSLGAVRLSAVGPPPLMFGVAVLAEMLLGSAVVVGLSHLRARQR